jgi:hypothetical protein
MNNRTLRRPMFRMGGSTGEGITSGLQAPRQNYVKAGDVQKIEDQRALIDRLAPRTERKDTSGYDFMINTGLDLISRPKSGNILSQLASSAAPAFTQFQKDQQIKEAYAQQGESDDRSLITELVKGLDEGTLSRSRKLADDMIAAKMTGEDGELLTYSQALEKAVSAIVYGVGKEPGELKLEGINTRTDVLLKQDEDLGYDSALRIAEAAQRIFDGDIEGVTKDDIDTDQLFIETEVLNNMELGENGELTLPTETKETSIGFDIYIEGMVYYNYRDGQFYRKSGKQFIPIQQPES